MKTVFGLLKPSSFIEKANEQLVYLSQVSLSSFWFLFSVSYSMVLLLLFCFVPFFAQFWFFSVLFLVFYVFQVIVTWHDIFKSQKCAKGSLEYFASFSFS